jgi:electron transfer flavoprotein alpha subunit
MILVIAEQRDGSLNRATWETIAAAQQWPGGLPIRVAVFGSKIGRVAEELAQCAVSEVLVVDHPALEVYTSDGFVQAISAVINDAAP